MKLSRTIFALAILASLAFSSIPAQADPLSGEVLKFIQMPLNGGIPTNLGGGIAPISGAPFPGHDELSTAYLNSTTSSYQGTYMADDFADNFNSPVVHVQWWGSYLNPNGAVPPSVQQFMISFESDVPAAAGTASHPGSPILSQIVTAGALAPGSGTFVEKALQTAPGATEQLFQYNAELALPFNESRDTVYWLKIVALENKPANDPTAVQWGWHDRDWSIPNPLASPVPTPGETSQPGNFLNIPIWHFQDDAVTGQVNINPLIPGPLASIQQVGFTPQNYIDGVDGPAGIRSFSKDLAFGLYTTPEPSSMALLGMGSVMLGLAAWRRRRRTR